MSVTRREMCLILPSVLPIAVGLQTSNPRRLVTFGGLCVRQSAHARCEQQCPDPTDDEGQASYGKRPGGA